MKSLIAIIVLVGCVLGDEDGQYRPEILRRKGINDGSYVEDFSGFYVVPPPKPKGRFRTSASVFTFGSAPTDSASKLGVKSVVVPVIPGSAFRPIKEGAGKIASKVVGIGSPNANKGTQQSSSSASVKANSANVAPAAPAGFPGLNQLLPPRQAQPAANAVRGNLNAPSGFVQQSSFGQQNVFAPNRGVPSKGTPLKTQPLGSSSFGSAPAKSSNAFAAAPVRAGVFSTAPASPGAFNAAPARAGAFGAAPASGQSFGAAPVRTAGFAAAPVRPATRFIPTAPQGSDEFIILRQINDHDEDGYNYAYETSNNIGVQEQGRLFNRGSDAELLRANGYYEFIGDDGQQYRVDYTADENGFNPIGRHLPTAPPTPRLIQKSLDYIARQQG